MNVIQRGRFDAIGSEVHGYLPPVMGGMVDNVEKDVLKAVGIGTPVSGFIADPFVKRFRVGDDLKRLPLVVIMDIPPGLDLVDLPNPEVGISSVDPGIPDIVAIEDVAEAFQAFFRNLFQARTAFDKLLVAKVVVVKKLMQICFHRSRLP
jgi:hypothetical protein